MKASDIRTRLCEPWYHGDHADLRGLTCEGRLDLAGLDVCGVDFTGSSFPDGINAKDARFLGLSWFTGCSFGADAEFSGATFFNDARFEDCRFGGGLDFDGSEFRGIGRFDRVQAQSCASFRQISAYGNFSLAGARLAPAADFTGAEWLGGLWCDGTQFPDQLALEGTQVHGRLWLRRALAGNHSLDAGAFPLAFGYTYV